MKNLKDFEHSWKFHRGHTIDLLKSCSDEDLNYVVGKNMGTLGQQFRHLTRVDDQYISAIETGRVENNRRKLELPIEKSVVLLLEQLEKDNERLSEVLNSFSGNAINDIKIDWSYWHEEGFTLFEHLQAMVEHEILHHGELIVYFRSMDKKFPDS